MVTCLINFFEEMIMLNDIFWDKSPCHDIGLKSFLQVVSLISKLKVCLQRVYMRVCQPYLHSGYE